MMFVTWMAAGSVGSWLLAALVVRRSGLELFLGMIGPLAVASVTWILMIRTYTRSPEKLTSLMVGAFAGKMIFFGAYVAVTLTLLGTASANVVPFVASFTGYFVALHLVEALGLRRLFAGRPVA